MRLVFALLASAAVAIASTAAQGPVPQFRTRTDLIRLDVSVLDRDRQPVRGLTAADFTIKEDGKPQRVEAFAAVDVPDPAPPTAAWMREVAPDVQTNQLDDRRLVVLVVDNWSGLYESWESRTGKKVAKDIISRLGPADVMAVVVVLGSYFSQDFTNDRALLMAAIDQVTPVLAPTRLRGDAVLMGNYVAVMTDVADYLLDLPDRRKAIIYVGTASAVVSQWQVVNLINAAKRANVNIYCFDTNGLRAPGVDPLNPYAHLIVDPGRRERETLLAISGETGGDATVNTNRPTDGVPQIFVENGSYYLLGYVSTNVQEDGKLRRIEVKVNRPRVEVRFRHGYYAPPDPAEAAKTPPPPVTLNAIAGLLPNRGVTMEAALAPIAVAGQREAAVAVAVGLRKVDTDGRAAGTVELLTRAFTPVGDPRGEERQRIPVTSRLEPGARYDVLTQMALLPGRYEFRISARDVAVDQTGSVYVFVDVPDFANEPLSLSGLVLSGGTTPANPPGALWGVLPVVPTSQRVFVQADRVMAWLRVYQGGKAALAPATVAVKIVDDHDRAVVDRHDAIEANAFDAATRSAEYRFDLPLASLTPGEYLLSLGAALDAKLTATRTARFRIK